MRMMLRIPTVFLAIVLSCIAYLGCSQSKPQVESLTQHDSLIFKGKADQIDGLDAIVQKAGLTPLRDNFVADGDLEIRIWRGFGLQPHESVFIRRICGNWAGDHVVTDEYAVPKNVKVSELKEPFSGWENLWASIKENGLLEFSAADADPCLGRTFDGTSYLVEISENGRYRNYMVPEGYESCRSSPQITRIGDIIGLEFDDGIQKCTKEEWFPCATHRKYNRF